MRREQGRKKIRGDTSCTCFAFTYVWSLLWLRLARVEMLPIRMVRTILNLHLAALRALSSKYAFAPRVHRKHLFARRCRRPVMGKRVVATRCVYRRCMSCVPTMLSIKVVRIPLHPQLYRARHSRGIKPWVGLECFV